LIVRGMLLKL